jgi:hypothetical protein
MLKLLYPLTWAYVQSVCEYSLIRGAQINVLLQSTSLLLVIRARSFRLPIILTGASSRLSSISRIFWNAQDVTASLVGLRRSSSIAGSLSVLLASL